MGCVVEGDIYQIMWWLSHKASVNDEVPKDSGNTPLHEAISLHKADVAGFLILVRLFFCIHFFCWSLSNLYLNAVPNILL